MVEGLKKLDKEISVVRRGTAIAVENIKQHVGNLHPKYEESKAWAEQTCEDQTFLLDNLEHALDVLASLEVFEELGYCIHGAGSAPQDGTSNAMICKKATMNSFLDITRVRSAATSSADISKQFANRVADLRMSFNYVLDESNRVIEGFQKTIQLSESDAGDQASRLMEEIEILARKINADYEHILGLPDAQKSISQASKTGHIHKANFLPALSQTNEEISQLLAQTIERKEQTMKISLRYLQEISVIESTVSLIHTKMTNLDVDAGDGKSFDLLNFVIRLPSIYGSLLVECVRRQEWTDKMKTDSSSLVEEMATYKEEESRRRKKWTEDMGGVVDLASLDGMALGIEVNVQAQKHKWSNVSRDDITAYLRRLRDLGDVDGSANEIEELVKALDTPSRQQVRRAKAFKNGSVHEAAYGRTSLLLRGDDEVILVLRSEKTKVEDKLKTAESRIRKLEDLLHRQGQFSRPSSAAGFPSNNAPTFERYATSPVTNFSSALSKARETGSRRSSVTSKRISLNNDLEEKSLAQRIVSLEAELIAEKARSTSLENKAASKTNAEDLLKSQVREAISTKEDLLGNLEAQQREFDHERRLLEGENGKLKVKLEELEDEFDRIFDSREHDDKVHALEEELERVRNDVASEVQRAHSQTDFLRNDCATQREKASRLEREVQRQRDVNAELSGKADYMSRHLQSWDNAQKDHYRALRTTLLHSSHDGEVPEDFGAMIEIVETVAEKSAAHLKKVQDALETLRADNASLETRNRCQGDEIYELRERLGSEERTVYSLREELNAQQTQWATLKSQLDLERDEHNELKARFASGQTDFESLRAKFTEGERITADQLGRIESMEAQQYELEGQLSRKEASLKSLQEVHDGQGAYHRAQSSRATEVSTRLLSHNKVLERLLEQVGLTVTKQAGAMVIQKAPKAASASTLLNDSSVSMKRSPSGPLPTNAEPESPIDPTVFQWATTDDIETAESQFAEFMKNVATFDLDVFSEAVYKRFKEIEHIARKWQKEARAYRDKAHRAQSDAHERIALRNFKEGDLALFLPTRDQATKPWAAFNVGAPHCFLREQDSHNLSKRDWLIARISRVEERVVDLSKSINGLKPSSDSSGERNKRSMRNDENPYELSDGLRWYLIDAAEEKPGAPINVGLGKVTVASANVDAKGSIRLKKSSDGHGATKTLTRSLDSRRSSTNSKKGLVAVASNSTLGNNASGLDGMFERSIDHAAAAAASSPDLQPPYDGQHSQDPERPQSSQTMETPAPGGPKAEYVGRINAPDW